MSGDDGIRRPASVLLVAGADGGCGASLVAGALALAWARAGAPVWLLELDVDRADRADAWGLAGVRSLADLAGVAAELDARHIGHAAEEGPSGLRILGAPPVPGRATPGTTTRCGAWWRRRVRRRETPAGS